MCARARWRRCFGARLISCESAWALAVVLLLTYRPCRFYERVKDHPHVVSESGVIVEEPVADEAGKGKL